MHPNNILSTSTGSLRIFSDGKVQINDETPFLENDDTTSVRLSELNGDAVLEISVKANREKNTLAFQAEVFPNGLARIRQENPHDGVDDIYLINKSQTKGLVSDYLSCDIEELTQALKNNAPSPEQSLLKRAFRGR